MAANGLAVRFNVDYAESIGTDTYVTASSKGARLRLIAHLSDHVAIEDHSLLALAVQPQRVHLFDLESSVNLNRTTFGA